MFTVKAMDHIVLKVRDMDAVLEFYVEVLGLAPERVSAFRAGEVPFPSVRVNADTLIDLFPVEAATPGGVEAPRTTELEHFCLVLDQTDMHAVAEALKQRGIAVHQGPVRRWGAHGDGLSVYFYDPEQRQIELRCYDD